MPARLVNHLNFRKRYSPMKKLRLCSILSILVLTAAAQAQDLPTYICNKTAVPPLIDGRGDDAVWQQAERTDMVDVNDLGRTQYPSRPTEVRMLWDDENLYVLYVATDSDAWSTLDNRDDHLWNQEVVELYLDPDGDGTNYAEIEINPLNTIVDLLLTRPWSDGGKGDFGWSPEYSTAVHVEGTVNDPSDVDQYWSVEIALPWRLLGETELDVLGSQTIPPTVGDQWRFNHYRFERIRVDGEETEIEYSAWSPVGRIDFHVPSRFGTVVFAKSTTAVEAATWGQLKSDR